MHLIVKRSTVLIVTSLLSVLACRDAPPVSDVKPPPPPAPADSAAVNAVHRILADYHAKRISPDSAASALVDVKGWRGNIAMDRPLQEAVVRQLKARGRLPRNYQLPPDSR